MNRSISAADANRGFSSLLRSVREGDSFTVTSHGKPVARIVPVDPEAEARRAAFKAHLEELRAREVIDIGPWTREDLYER